jgi:PRTRC genetic system protein E
MFTQLQKMLRNGDSVTIAVENNTQLRVSVFPKLAAPGGESGEPHKALSLPLSLVATPAELDSPAFLETLEKFTASAGALRHTLDEVEAAHKTAAESARAKAKPAAKHKPEPATPPKSETPEPSTEELVLE